MAAIAFDDLDRSSHDEVRALILAGLAEHWGTVDESLNTDLDDMLATYRAGRTLVARDTAGTIVGTGTVIPRSAGTAEVLRMSVRKDLRSTGIGRQLLAELVATARRWGCMTVVLETTSAWTGAVAFYRRNGFEITHTEDGAFGTDTWFALDLGEP